MSEVIPWTSLLKLVQGVWIIRYYILSFHAGQFEIKTIKSRPQLEAGNNLT